VDVFALSLLRLHERRVSPCIGVFLRGGPSVGSIVDLPVEGVFLFSSGRFFVRVYRADSLMASMMQLSDWQMDLFSIFSEAPHWLVLFDCCKVWFGVISLDSVSQDNFSRWKVLLYRKVLVLGRQ
jgi:hypothetical protein